jgi:hypothetical protein
MMAISQHAASAEVTLVTIYRTVRNDELEDILECGQYRVKHGQCEGKYFFPTTGQMSGFARMNTREWWPYTPTSAGIQHETLTKAFALEPIGEGLAYFFPTVIVPTSAVQVHTASLIG